MIRIGEGLQKALASDSALEYKLQELMRRKQPGRRYAPYIPPNEESRDDVLASLKNSARIVLGGKEAAPGHGKLSYEESRSILEELIRRYQYDYNRVYGQTEAITDQDIDFKTKFLAANKNIDRMDRCIDGIRNECASHLTREQFAIATRHLLDPLSVHPHTAPALDIDLSTVLEQIVTYPV